MLKGSVFECEYTLLGWSVSHNSFPSILLLLLLIDSVDADIQGAVWTRCVAAVFRMDNFVRLKRFQSVYILTGCHTPIVDHVEGLYLVSVQLIFVNIGG